MARRLTKRQLMAIHAKRARPRWVFNYDLLASPSRIKIVKKKNVKKK